MTRAVSGLLFVALTACGVASTPGASGPPTLRVQGRQFVDESGRVYIPRWVSGLSLLARSPAEQSAFLDWAQATGFNGVRVFAGALPWAKQSPEGARAGLPGLLDRAAARELVVEVTALTETGLEYDAKAHLQAVAQILSGRRGVLLELANEVGHPTQSKDLTPERLRAWGNEIATPRALLWAVGAHDESAQGGTYVTVHLDRGPPLWEQIAGVRAIGALADRLGVPVISNEPIGADEEHGRVTGRQRWDEPAGFFALGVLDRAFGTGGVHHSQAGLMAERPGPVQQQCAAAYVEGHRAVEELLPGVVGHFQAVGDNGYAFTAGDRGVLVLLGVTGESQPQVPSGWRHIRRAASRSAQGGSRIDVIEIAR